MTTATDQAIHVREKIYIGGEWVQSDGSGTLEVINPTTEQVMGSDTRRHGRGRRPGRRRRPRGLRGLVADLASQERADWMSRIAGALGARMDEIAELIAQEVGMPLKLSQHHPGRAADGTFASMPQLLARAAVGGAGRQLADRARARRRGRRRSRPGTTRCTRSPRRWRRRSRPAARSC